MVNITDSNDVFYNMSNNLTHFVGPELEHAPQLSRSAILRVIILSAMAVISFLGNIATMWNIYRTRISRRGSRHSWSAIYTLIFHLSIADVLVTGFCIVGEAIWSFTVQWLADDLTCKFFKFVQMFSLYLSTFVLVLIGVDRWVAVRYPMKSLNMAKRCYRLLAGSYALAFILSIPQVFIFRLAKGPFYEEFYQCVTHGFYTAKWEEQLYTTFTLFFTFIIPLCILSLTYLSTFKAISGSEKMFQSNKTTTATKKQTNRQRIIHKAKMKSLRISVVIISAFIICWTPYNVMMITFMFLNPDKTLGDDMQSAIFFFGMSNSIVNPLIYGAFQICPLRSSKREYSRQSSTRSTSMTGTTQVFVNRKSILNRSISLNRNNSKRSSMKSNNEKKQISTTKKELNGKNVNDGEVNQLLNNLTEIFEQNELKLEESKC